jgi:hypothetical protein
VPRLQIALMSVAGPKSGLGDGIPNALFHLSIRRAKSSGQTREDLERRGAKMCLLGRWADAREVVEPILWLASDEASYVTGSRLMVDGGQFTKTVAGVPKVALDFLLRPATMTSRQHSGTKLSIRRGKLARRRQHHCCAGGCRYGGMVHAPAAVPALRRIHPVLAPKSSPTLERGNTDK